jgi:hypothetical protein
MNRGATAPVEASDDPDEVEQSVSAPTDQENIERELTHDEFDPKGTLTLILIYFAVLVLMWVFMYFIEFLGNELVVVG